MKRELVEETGLNTVASRLVDVHDIHTVAPGRGDRFEDYHGIHLLYAVTVEPGVEPRVTEVAGTTDAVRWIPLAELHTADHAILPAVRHVLNRLDQYRF